MMVGLLGAGKTTWVNQRLEEFPERQYNILGVPQLMEQMKVSRFTQVTVGSNQERSL